MRLGLRAGALSHAAALATCLIAITLAGCKEETPPSTSTALDGGGGSGGDDDRDGGGDASIEGGAGANGDRDGAAGEGGNAGSAGVGGANGGNGGGGEGGGSATGGGGGFSGGQGGGDPDAGGSSGEGGNTAPPDAVCFGGGDEASSSGTGACATPFVIDMRSLEYGDTVFAETGSAATNGQPPNIGKCAEATERDVVFNVRVPSDADLEVSVDGVDGSDPTILVQEGPDTDCDKKAATDCVDDTEDGACEYLRIRTGSGGFDSNTPQIVISEGSASSASYVVRFRLVDPGGGS